MEVGDTFIRMGKMEKEYLKDVYDNFFKPFSNHLQVCHSEHLKIEEILEIVLDKRPLKRVLHSLRLFIFWVKLFELIYGTNYLYLLKLLTQNSFD